MNLQDPRVSNPLIFAFGGLLLYAAVIAAGLLGDSVGDRHGAWLLFGNAAVGIGTAAIGRMRPAAIAGGLGAMVIGQVAIILILVRAGTGIPGIIIAVHAVLGVPFLLGLVLALLLHRAHTRAS